MKITRVLFATVTIIALAVPGVAGQLRHYTNAKLGWSVSYPAGWKVDPHYIADTNGGANVQGVSFTIPDNLQHGTNLSSDQTSVAVESLPGKGCKPQQFLEPGLDDGHVRKVMADGRTYWTLDSSEGAAGNLYNTTVFVVDGTSPCIAVSYLIHSTNIGNYDPGTIKAFDEKKLTGMFDAIRASLTLKK